MSDARRTSAFWDEDKVRAAVDEAASVVEALDLLGYPNKPSNRQRLKEACSRWNLRWPAKRINVPKSAPQAATGRIPTRSWTDSDLRRAAAGAASMSAVIKALGLQPAVRTFDRVEKRAEELGILLPARKSTQRQERPVDEEAFTAAALEAANRSHMIDLLGWGAGAASYQRLERVAARLSVTLPGKRVKRRPGAGVGGPRRRPLEEILVENSTARSTYVRKRLIDEGVLEERCVKCKIGPVWCGEPITLQLDHINGDSTDNRLENLRILCPNCHSQTDTYCGRNLPALNGSGGRGRTRASRVTTVHATVYITPEGSLQTVPTKSPGPPAGANPPPSDPTSMTPGAVDAGVVVPPCPVGQERGGRRGYRDDDVPRRAAKAR